MNTEKLIALKNVRETLNVVTIKIPDLPVNSIERKKLEESCVDLEEILMKIIHEDIVAVTDELRIRALKLNDISVNLKTVSNNLNEICDKIEKTSVIVKAIADIASIAGSAGLI